MKLYIDATDNLKTIIRLDDRELVKVKERPQDQDVLGAIMEALDLQGSTPAELDHHWRGRLKDLRQVEVNPGPGSFTGTRVGVAIANALGFALGVTVNGRKPPISPVYSEGPHITKAKK